MLTQRTYKATRRGTIYPEVTNKGSRRTPPSDEIMPVYFCRWVAEIHIRKKRYRFRSTSYDNARSWLDEMISKQDSLQPNTNKPNNNGQEKD